MSGVFAGLAQERQALQIIRSAGLIPSPRVFPALAWEGLRGGLAGAGAMLGRLHGDRVAVVDPMGSLTYRELGRQCSALSAGLQRIGSGGRRPVVALMTRNSRYSLIGLVGAVGVGAKLVFINTDLGGKQIGEVCARERVGLLIHDEVFESRLEGLDPQISRLVAVRCTTEVRDDMASLIAEHRGERPRWTLRRPEVIILTSGSSGAPKGSKRSGGNGQRPSLAMGAGLFQKIPYRAEDVVYVAAPLYHGWGAAAAGATLALGGTLVLEPGFDADQAVQLIAKHRCTALIFVPTMIRRLLALGHDTLAQIDHESIRIIGSGGAKLEAALVDAVYQEFGAVLHNLYGATEAAIISVATPSDLVAAPDTAGRAPIGVTVKIYSGDCEAGVRQVGDIYVGSPMTTADYTDGRRKETKGGLLKTGDTGYFDERGLLFVVGRSDGMIVSGGENVFPEEVEGALLAFPGIADAKVVPVDDVDFGQRLKAYVVAESGSAPTIDDLKAYLSSELSRSRIPRDVVFVEDLKRTATGKVTKQVLDELEQALSANGGRQA
ncbi:AMP-binding protein [Mycolicibacter minnesotensis]